MMFPPFRGFVRTFVLLCLAVFVLQGFARFGFPEGAQLYEQLQRFFGLVPDLFTRGMIYQGITWVFFHGSLTHLLFNMLGFWMFGSLLQDTFGEKRFIIFCTVAAFCTAIIVGTVGLLDPLVASVPTIGASGLVFAVLIAVSRLFPNQMVLFFFIFPMKMKYFAYLLIAIEFWALYSSNNHGVSNAAHLAGALVGWIYVSYLINRNRGGFSDGGGSWNWLKYWKERWHQRRMRKKLRVVRRPEERQHWH